MKIYLSSTYEDLQNHRSVVFDALRQSGYQVIAMEDYVARDERPVDACLKDVAEADIYVGIFGLRYGYVPSIEHNNPDGLSITELEYRQANKQPNTHCLTLLLNEDDALPPKKYIDALSGNNEKGTRIKRLRDDLQREKTARFFSYARPYELASLVQRSVAKYAQEHRLDNASNEASKPMPTWDVAKSGPPYPGLLHFTRKYTPVFFGRELEVREVLDRLYSPEGRFLIISGDSGSGKSSLVDAGVLPVLEESGLSDNTTCACVRMVPSHGDHPFDALTRALNTVIENAGLNPNTVGKTLLQNPQTLPDTLQTIIKNGVGSEALVLFLDQMEELFGGEAEDRHLADAFLTHLFAASQQGVLSVIATVRNDLLHHCYAHADMLKVLKGQGHYPLGRIMRPALTDLIVKPAEAAGVSVPEALTQRLIEDVGTEPGNLPLLAFALRRLFERRTDDTLSLALYDDWGGEELGGLKGAIAEHAAEVEKDLCEDKALHLDQESLAARLAAIFPSLVRADLEGLPTRRYALITDFTTAQKPLVQALVDARLLTTEGTGEQSTVSVAHERLFDAWPTLERWVAGHQDDLRTLRQAELDAAEWKRQGYDLAHVWHPERLIHLQELLKRYPARRSRKDLNEFAQPQARLIELLKKETLSHEERRTVGRYLEELGDPRPGTGVKDGIPEIDWVPIDGGHVILEDNAGEQTVPDFEIARYPVTNSQFQDFIDAEDGYRNPDWWQDMPKDANDGPSAPAWQEALCPRETVSWYEAVAFCLWLSQRLGRTVRLPTEFEWQHAATQGEVEQRAYPWGPDWQEGRCNSTESRLNRTTVVGLYQHGTWQNGPLDMAGNVWEWCLNKYDKPKDEQTDKSGDQRVLRGGSWDDFRDYCRAASRYYYSPGYRSSHIGFRLLRPPSSDL